MYKIIRLKKIIKKKSALSPSPFISALVNDEINNKKKSHSINNRVFFKCTNILKN